MHSSGKLLLSRSSKLTKGPHVSKTATSPKSANDWFQRMKIYRKSGEGQLGLSWKKSSNDDRPGSDCKNRGKAGSNIAS